MWHDRWIPFHAATGTELMPEISARQVKICLAVAIALQVFVVGLFYFDIIHDPDHGVGDFIFHHGGDEAEYFALAQSLIKGSPLKSQFSLGFPVMLVPWILILHPKTATDLKVPVALFNSLLLFPLAQTLFLSFAVRLLRSRTIAVIGLFIWTVLPVALFVGVALTGRPALGAIWAVHLPWLQVLSDPPAAVLTLTMFWIMFRQLDAEEVRHQRLWAALLGAICGLALLVRANTILTVAIVFLILAASRRWSAFVIAGAATALTYTPQFAYNIANF